MDCGKIRETQVTDVGWNATFMERRHRIIYLCGSKIKRPSVILIAQTSLSKLADVLLSEVYALNQ